MEEPREESEFVGDFREPMEEAEKGVGLSSKTETLSSEDATTVEASDSGVFDVSGIDVQNDGGSVNEDGTTDNFVSDEKQVKAKVEDMVGSVCGEEFKEDIEKTVSFDDVEKTDAFTEPETERNDIDCGGDAGTDEVKPVDEKESSDLCNDVQRASKTVKLAEVEINDGEGHESVLSSGNAVTDEKEKVEVEDKRGACDPEQSVQSEKSQQILVDGEMLPVAGNRADQEKVSTKKSEHEKEENVTHSYNEQGDSGCETLDADQKKEVAKKGEEDDNKMDVDSKQAKEEILVLNEQINPGSETTDAKNSESVIVPEESIQLSEGEMNEVNPGTVSELSSAAETRHEEEITKVNKKEDNGEDMEIDYATEEQVEKDVKVGGTLNNSRNESPGANKNDSNVVKEMEIDERKDSVDMAIDLTRTIKSADSAHANSATEDAATGEVEPLDHALFDPSSDITNFIDFSGVSSWSGNIQDLKTETGNVSLKEDKKATDMGEEVSTLDDNVSLRAEEIHNDSSDACIPLGAESAATERPTEASDAIMGSVENQEVKDHQCLDEETANHQDKRREEDDISDEDPNQKEDTEMEENSNNFDFADDEAGSGIKTNGTKVKADVLSEDSPGEGRKTVSVAKASFAQRASFKIGACIARAASQMAGSPSVVKGSNFGDETLDVESFVSQLHCAATDPVKEDIVSDIANGFFLDFRNSLASQQVTAENVSSKRVKLSNSNAAGTEAFEFEEMGDTYWTDRLIHNGGEEQTPPTDRGSYQIVPVELKPAKVQRTRRPYRRRQTQISIPNSASEKPANFDENAPAELIMNFSETDTIPPEKSLSKMFRHFGPINESQSEVDTEKHRARVVFKKGADAEIAYNSVGRINIFGTKSVKYELSYTITETFKVQPYVVSLGEEDAALCPPS